MVRPPYTQLLYSNDALGSGLNVVPEVVAGTIWVVRNITMINNQNCYTDVHGFNIQRASDFSRVWELGAPNVRGSKSYLYEGRQVVDGGDQLEIITFDSSWGVSITGYIFAVV